MTMFLTRWLQTPKSKRPARRPRFRPAVEDLEDRSVPAVLNVTTALDVIDPSDGLLSLREAVLAANAAPGADTINLFASGFNLSLAGADEDSGATGDLDIHDDLTIVGAGQYITDISAYGLDRVFQIFGASVEFSRLSLDGGQSGQGAGISSQNGTLRLTHCSIYNNAAFGWGTDVMGVGVYLAGGSLSVTHSLIGDNQAVTIGGGSALGAGIYNAGGTVAI